MQFCIVGTGRCGSTLLRNMMNLHPRFFVFPETHWIPKMNEFFGTAPAEPAMLLDVINRTKHVTGLPTTEIDTDQILRAVDGRDQMTVREFCDVVGQVFATQSGKDSWADKTPDYGYFMACLQTIWPYCRFIHIIRDGLAVARSMSRHIGYRAMAAERQLFWCPLSLDYEERATGENVIAEEKFVQLWYQRMIRTKDEATRLRDGSYLELKYENLLRSPQEELETIATFLGVETPRSWLASAGELVNPAKLSASRPAEMLAHFGDKHRHLLAELGYPV